MPTTTGDRSFVVYEESPLLACIVRLERGTIVRDGHSLTAHLKAAPRIDELRARLSALVALGRTTIGAGL